MDRGHALRSLSLLLALLAAGCAWAQQATQSESAQGTSLRYRVRLAADLGSLDVTVCFRGHVFGGFMPGRAEAAARLRNASFAPGDKPATVDAQGHITVEKTQREGCLRYAVELSEGGDLSALVTRVNGSLVASPNAWLWRPLLRPLLLDARLSLELPPGIHASLPFVRAGADYVVHDSVFAFDSHAAFGPFEELDVEEAGVRAHAAVLGSVAGLSKSAAERWLRDAVRIASSSDGRFPAAALHVLVIPQAGSDQPFGSVARGGGASVLLFVPQELDARQLARDWVLPHELSHLLLPFVQREDAWLAEGLATYYQELSRARAGVISDQEALANLSQGLRSAVHEGSGRSLCDESRSMHQTHAYRAVYWGGTAALLRADVALRSESEGRVTLDQLLTRVRNEARMTPPYSATELLERFDALSHSRVFRELGEQCERAPFPDFEPTLRALGVDGSGLLPPEAPLAAVRAALFAPQRAAK